jgi:hypothetical protein
LAEIDELSFVSFSMVAVWRTMLPDFAHIDGAVLFGLVASIGNLLQGWDNASIAGKDKISCFSVPIIYFYTL